MTLDANPARYRIGVDENGLGPRLGPMLVSAVMARVTEDGHRVVGKPARGGLADRLGDSKALVSHGDVALGEAWARAIVQRGLGRTSPRTESPDALVAALSLDAEAPLRARCPKHVEDQCWSPDGEELTAPASLVQRVLADLDGLGARGVEIVAVRCVILCSRTMNDGLDRGQSRFVLDLHAMERLVLAMREIAGEPVSAVCGKVGGFGKYGPVFGPLSGYPRTVLEETRARSAYQFAGVGEVSFVRDADASDLCVSMASLVGKYVREVLMGRVARHYQRQLPNLPDASGYYDPVTTRFIEATRLLRSEGRVPEECFERRSGSAAAERS